MRLIKTIVFLIVYTVAPVAYLHSGNVQARNIIIGASVLFPILLGLTALLVVTGKIRPMSNHSLPGAKLFVELVSIAACFAFVASGNWLFAAAFIATHMFTHIALRC